MNITNSRIIDLTHSLSSENPTWSGSCGFNLTLDADYTEFAQPDRFRVQSIASRAGMGTHMDAPAHCFPAGKTIESIELENLIIDCVTINCSATADENFVATPETITAFERTHGKIQPNSFVIFNTGWATHWSNPTKYRNDLRFPSIHEGTAKFLLERHIVGLGTDTLSADAKGNAFPVHRVVLGAGKYLVENIANAAELPASGAKLLVMPIKIESGTEAPIRLVALT